MLLVIFLLIILIITGISTKLKLDITISKMNLNVLLKICIFNNILIYKVNLNKRKNKSNKFKNKIRKYIKNKIKFIFLVHSICEKSKMSLEHLNLKIDISTTDSILTSYMVGITANFITFILHHFNFKINYKECSYKINPIYTNNKILDIKLNCIISVNMVHIIIVIFRNFKKWRGDKNGRKSSNRRTYGCCNE